MSICHSRCASKSQGPVRRAVSLPCLSWLCDHCQPKRRKQLIAEACGGAASTFITLTLKPDPTSSPEKAAAEISRAWRILRLRIMRKRKWKRLDFLAVFEPHASGWPHLHILARCGWIAQSYLSAQWEDITGSDIVDIRAIDHRGRIAGYVAKYVGDCQKKFGTSKRYWQTPGYDLRPKPLSREKAKPGEGWERQSMTLLTWCRAFEYFGWSVRRINAHTAEARQPP